MRLKAFLLGGAIIALGQQAFAQGSNGAVNEVIETGDIVVTAQRRSERLQDVPVAITAANAEQLASARVSDISNVSSITPSVTFNVANIASSSANIQIRGLGTTGQSRAFEGAVGVFIDGVYRSRAAAALQAFNDIGNLQILRGPQGTLFGKNTSAGAVLVDSIKPDLNKTAGRYELSYGNYDTVSLKGGVSTPLNEKAAIRIAGLYSDRDGYYEDVNTGKTLSGEETYAIKAQLLAEPTETVSIHIIGDYLKSSGNCCYATVNYKDGPVQPLINALALGLGQALPSSDIDDREVAVNRVSSQKIRDYGGAAIAELELGEGSLKSTTGLRYFSVSQAGTDPDFSGADIFGLDEKFRSKFFSQELTYNGKVQSIGLDYVVGAYYAHEALKMGRITGWGSQAQLYWDTVLSLPPFSLPPGTVNAGADPWTIEDLGGKNNTYALFAHMDYKISNQWNVIFGLRYSIERKLGRFDNPYYTPVPNDVFRVIGVQPGPVFSRKITNRAVSGTLGLQYRPNSDAMLYATYNRGFKAGGVNIDANAAGTAFNNPSVTPGAVPLDPSYKPEKVDSFELGGKFVYLDRRARTNVALFYSDISDLQVAQFIGLQFTVLNAKSANVYGAEIENNFDLGGGVSLALDGTWLPHAKYGTDINIDPALSGRRFRYASKFAGNATLSLDRPVSTDFSLTGRMQYQYASSQYISTSSDVTRPGVGLVNASLGVKEASSKWHVEAWVQNLFKKTYANYAFDTPLQFGDENAYLNAPRTFGVTVRGNF